ncbi:Ribonuclease H2 subunit A [Bonamia ostreae]|uniref:Ribonuclease n=1 Tax=Bonamia ostreae TaxID=126728 RepID=A0ABV2AGU8_9EUKA
MESVRSENAEYIAGIDEAGRGPVLGPMVYCICLAKKGDIELVAKEGFNDSKTLSAKSRNSFFKIIKKSDFLHFFVHSASALFISKMMNRRKAKNLNVIARQSTFKCIEKALESGFNVTKIFVDTVGPELKHQKALKTKFPQIDFCVKQKADSIYPIVSAASICAKVSRDESLKRTLKRLKISVDVGSGYTNDPKTRKFLKTAFHPMNGFPKFVRTSWKTAKNVEALHTHPIWSEDEQSKSKDEKKQKTFKQSKYYRKRKIGQIKQIK